MYVRKFMPVEGNVDPGIQLKWPGVVASTFTCCSVLGILHSQFFEDSLDLRMYLEMIPFFPFLFLKNLLSILN